MFKNINLDEPSDDQQRRLSIISTGTWPDEENKPSMPPPMFGAFYSGWSHSLITPPADTHHPHDTPLIIFPTDEEKDRFDDADDTSFSSRTSNSTNEHHAKIRQDTLSPPPAVQRLQARRKSSIQVGNEVMMELLKKDNVKHAVEILQQALQNLNMTQQDEDEEGDNKEEVTKIYSQIMKMLCDPNISKIVDEMTPTTDIYKSILWRLFTKIVESGHVLERDAHLTMVGRLVDKGHTSLALQAMYALPRLEWDTQAYRIAILLHLMQDPKQIVEAQRLLSDYGKPYLDIANPMAPTDLPPMRIDMPLMKDITDNDQLKLWMFYQSVQSKDTSCHWNQEKESYEQKRRENLESLKQRQDKTIDWALEQLHLESKKSEVDKQCIDNDNTMIFVAMNNQQFEYGWQVYKAMNESVNESTPCIIMHLCYLAFRQIPIIDISYRTTWEERAWSIYSRFMCSEYLHPNQQDAPSFIHDILSIALHSPEVMIDIRARYTKTMSVYNLLERLHFDRLLSDDRVLEPILCTLLYECKGSALNIINMCKKAFEIWDTKLQIQEQHRAAKAAEATQQQSDRDSINTNEEDVIESSTPYTIIWGLLVLCLKSGNLVDFKKVISQLIDNDFQLQDIFIPSSLLAPIQKFHDDYTCSYRNQCCYFQDYMFRYMEYTDSLDNTLPVKMNEYGFLLTSDDIVYDRVQQMPLHSNIHEPQEPNIAQAILIGAAAQGVNNLNAKEMYYSTRKAKALIRHIIKVIPITASVDQQ